MSEAILAVDIGTSTLKCGFIDGEGRLLCEVREPLPAYRGLHHIDPADGWVDAFARAVPKLHQQMRESRTGAAGIRAVCIGGNGPTLVPVDADGGRCGDTALWSSPDVKQYVRPDAVSLFLPAAAALLGSCGEGSSRPARSGAAADKAGETIGAVRRLSGCPEYLAGRLTGVWKTFLPSSAFIPYIWDEAQSRLYGVPCELLPPFIPIGEQLGAVSHTGASWSGLKPGIPVFAGGPDYLMALLGTAVVSAGDACDRAGTSEAVNVCLPETFSRGKKLEGIRVLPHAVTGYASHAVMLPVSGQALISYLQQLDVSPDSYQSVIDAILGHDWVSGIFREKSGADDVIMRGREIAETIGFAVRQGIDLLKSNEIYFRVLRIAGGQGRNHRWNQLKANIIGEEIEVPQVVDAELLGAAAAALTGLREYASLQEACAAVYRVKERIAPDAELHERFSERYDQYIGSRRDLF